MEEKTLKPRIRFKGFTEAWEQRKIGECFSERIESDPNGELISVTIGSGIKKFSELGRHDSSNDDKSKYKKVVIGDIAYNSMRMWQGASGYSPYNGIVSPAYTVITPFSGIDSQFFAYMFKREDMIHTFQVRSQGITSDNWNLKYPTLREIEVILPSDTNEQKAISSYLTVLDTLITLHQRKFEKLSQIKKSLLEKMFPADGENTPKIRFRGFTEAWEQRKCSDISARFDNLRIPVAESKRVSGPTPYYGANGIQDYVEGYTHDGEFVLVAEDGANDLKNYPVQYINGRIWVNNHAHVLQSNKENSTLFLKYLINSADIESVLVGGGRAKLNANVLMNLEFTVPKKLEQDKIALVLQEMDSLITLHQRKYEKLKNIKKSLLEKMFI